MAFHLGTIIPVLFLFGIIFTYHRKLEQFIRTFQRPFRQHNEKFQDRGSGQVLCNGQEKAQYLPSPAGKPYYMTMGLKRLDLENWLTIDSEYMKEHVIRKELLDNSLPGVVQCLPGSELACTETLNIVVDFLISRFPETFILEGSEKSLSICNKSTGERFSLVDVANPLEIAARLGMEDFNILIKDPADGQYHLMASATLFPVGWMLQERIGGTLATLHKPVPKWQEKLSCPIDRYFDRLSPTSTMERQNTFIQTTPHLFLTTPLPSLPTPIPIPANEIMLRQERQTFRRLPTSNAVLFTVHTYMSPITNLSDDGLSDFVAQMRGWPEEVARYKGRDFWGPAVERYFGERFGNPLAELEVEV